MSGKAVGKKAYARLVDLMLVQAGTPRNYLFEYPYNEYESNERIKNAELAANDVLKTLGLTRKQ